MMKLKYEPEFTRRKITYETWVKEGETLYGPRRAHWYFTCPVCKYPQSYVMFEALKVPEPEKYTAFSCIGRFIPDSQLNFRATQIGPCNYAGGGLFRLNPVTVVHPGGESVDLFEFTLPFLAYPAELPLHGESA